MDDKQAYEQKLKARMDAWRAEIDRLEANAREAEADASIKAREQLRDIKSELADAGKHLEAIRTIGNDTWQELKTEADKTWRKLEERIESARKDAA